MTAYSMEDDKEKFINAGMDDYLPKPIKAEAIRKIIAKWVLKEEEEERKDKLVVQSTVEKLEIINIDTLNQLKLHLDDGMIGEVYESFEIETQELIQGIGGNDWEIIRANLHTLKGNASTLGLEEVAYWATLIESKLKKKNTSNFESDFFNLNVAFNNYKNNYRQILNIYCHAGS
jgi:HPt (histidine-containing phosphotransfer) domain-containing protein